MLKILKPSVNLLMKYVSKIQPTGFGNNLNVKIVHQYSCLWIRSAHSLKEGPKKTSLVIFDKDGTLVQFGVGWTDWTRELTRKIEKDSGLKLGDKILTHFGYDLDAKKWREGIMCDNPAIIAKALADFLESQGLDMKQAELTVKHTLADDHTTDPSQIQPIDQPLAMLKTLKHFSLQTAICTSDSKYSTYQAIDKLKLEPYCDYILCGDDEEFLPKPNPSNIQHICRVLGVNVNEAVMVGDTVRDMNMGKLAGVGSAIGVECGVCEKKDLQTTADFVVPSVADSMAMYLPDGFIKVYKAYCKE